MLAKWPKSSGVGTLIWTGRGDKKCKIYVSFCPQIAKLLQQPKMFNGSKGLAHSLVI